MIEEPKSWQVPPFEELPSKRQGWIEECLQEGDAWLKAQESYQQAESNIKLLGVDRGPLKLKTNQLKSDIRKFVETISDIREIATYGTGAEQFKQYAEMLNKVTKHIYYTSQFARQRRKTLQWAIATGRGYTWPQYIRGDFGWGEGNMVFQDMSLFDVLPCQLPADNDIQGAYACTGVKYLGIAEAHARFPNAQDKLIPVAKMKLGGTTQVQRLDFYDRFRMGKQNSNWDERYCEIRYTFIRDLRINDTGRPLTMGDKGTSWCYTVPFIGQLLESVNPQNGMAQSRFATADDCRIYPQLRLIITNPGMNAPLYDGPAFDWHGMIPFIADDVDDWPWLAVGYSLMQDVAGVERASRDFIDLMYRVSRVNMNPPVGYDLNAGIPNEQLKKMNWLDSSGLTIGMDGGEGIGSPLPESMKISAEHFQMCELFDKLKQKSLGLNDLSSLAELKFNLSSETADKILETIGPIAKGIDSNIAASNAKIAYMLKFNVFQYYNTKRTLKIVGPEGMPSGVFDFDPTTLIPSHLPGQDESQPSPTDPVQRAKWAAQNLEVAAVSSSLLNVTQMQEQLKYLNLYQQQFPISAHDVADKLGIDGYGTAQGATGFDRWKWEKREMALAQIETMKTVAGQMPPQPAAPPEGGDNGGNAVANTAAGGRSGQGKNGGRPPTAQAPPKLEQRGQTTGHPRTVISQSK